MESPSVVIEGGKEFVPREWLRREVLWGSLVVPYNEQLINWKNGIEFSYYDSNDSRRDVFDRSPELEEQSAAFFNHGKSIATIVSGAIMFNLRLHEKLQTNPSELLSLQAKYLDLVIKDTKKTTENSEKPEEKLLDPEETYQHCTYLISKAAEISSRKSFGAMACYFWASRHMIRLAAQELDSWTTLERKDLTIPDGGHPRSAGPRVDKLQPIFKEMVTSRDFKNLALAKT